jgi:hypothetical protein
MRFTRFFLILLSLAAVCGAQTQAAPAAGSKDAAKAQSTPSAGQDAAKPETPKVAVDAAKVTGSTFESKYFKFTYELPKDWKAMDDAARVASNRELLKEDAETAATPIPRKASAKTPLKGTNKSNGTIPQTLAPARYSLMAAGPNGIDSLASPVLPRINIWAHRRVPPLDQPLDNAQMLITGKHTNVLTQPQEMVLNGTKWARVQLVTPTGDYHSRYVIELGDYLVGFDFWASSEREIVELSDTIKSVKFN